MFIESGQSSGAEREHFHLELRRPINRSLALVGGTRADKIADFDEESLFAGLRLERGVFYGVARLLRGMTDRRTGNSVEAGALIRLPDWLTFPLRGRRGRLELVLSGERDDPGDDRVGDFVRGAVRIRYTISR